MTYTIGTQFYTSFLFFIPSVGFIQNAQFISIHEDRNNTYRSIFLYHKKLNSRTRSPVVCNVVYDK